MHRKSLVLALLLTAMIGTAMAGDRVEITPAIGYRMGGNLYDFSTRQDIDIKAASSPSITLGFLVNEDVTVEVLWSHQDTRFDFGYELPPSLDDDGLDIDYWHAGVMMRPGDGDTFEPFIVATAGFTHLSPHATGASSDTRFSLAGGGGLRAMFNDHVGVRLQGKIYLTFVNGSTAGWCGGGGCSIGYYGDALWQLDVSAGLIIAF